MATNNIPAEPLSFMSDFKLITGGAKGADSCAENLAKQWRMNVVLHKAEGTTDVDVEFTEPHVHQAALGLNRHPPKKIYVKKLMARNYRIMSEAQAVFAFGRFYKSGEKLIPINTAIVRGGTGWTVQMTVDHNRTYPADWKPLLVYDLEEKKWFQLTRGERWTVDEYGNPPPNVSPFMFLECVRPPILAEVSAVVGCRAMTDSGKKEMKSLFDRTGCEAYRVSEQCSNEYDEWVSSAISNAGASLKECPPELPAGIPTPPPLEDGQTFPWLYVRNTGWVKRKEETKNPEKAEPKPNWDEKVKKWREMQMQWLKEDVENIRLKEEKETEMEAEMEAEMETEMTPYDTCK